MKKVKPLRYPIKQWQINLLVDRVLGYGYENRISGPEIAERIGMEPYTYMGLLVNAARHQGYLVGSRDGEGYWLIETKEELADTIGLLSGRIKGTQSTIAALKRAGRKAGL